MDEEMARLVDTRNLRLGVIDEAPSLLAWVRGVIGHDLVLDDDHIPVEVGQQRLAIRATSDAGRAGNLADDVPALKGVRKVDGTFRDVVPANHLPRRPVVFWNKSV